MNLFDSAENNVEPKLNLCVMNHRHNELYTKNQRPEISDVD